MTTIKGYSFSILIVLILSAYAGSQTLPLPEMSPLRVEDKIRMREAINISTNIGDKIWKGFSKPPFPIVMVYDDVEYLVFHPNPPADFQLVGFDDLLKARVYARKRVFRKAVLSVRTLNNIPTIIAGTPESLRMISVKWIIKLLHERFHQYQQYSEGFLKDVEKLEIDKVEDRFRFSDIEINAQCRQYTTALVGAIEAIGTTGFNEAFKNYRSQRLSLMQKLTPEEYRYFSFMIWMEGMAQYTEYKFLTLLEKYIASDELKRLPDYSSFAKYKEKWVEVETVGLKTSELKDEKEVLLYSIGYAEGRLLDVINKHWRKNYLKKKFYIEKYAEK